MGRRVTKDNIYTKEDDILVLHLSNLTCCASCLTFSRPDERYPVCILKLQAGLVFSYPFLLKAFSYTSQERVSYWPF